MRVGLRGTTYVSNRSSQTEVSGVPSVGPEVEDGAGAAPKSRAHVRLSHWRIQPHIELCALLVCNVLKFQPVAPRREVVWSDGVPGEVGPVDGVAGPGRAQVADAHGVQKVDEPPDALVRLELVEGVPGEREGAEDGVEEVGLLDSVLQLGVLLKGLSDEAGAEAVPAHVYDGARPGVVQDALELVAHDVGRIEPYGEPGVLLEVVACP